MDQQARRRPWQVTGRVIYLDQQEEVELLLYNRVREEYVWNPGDPFGHQLIPPCSTVMVNRCVQQPGLKNM